MKNIISTIAACTAAISMAGLIVPAQAQDVSATPTYGEITLRAGFSGDPWSRDLQAGGNIDAQASVGANCRGMIANAPDVDLYYTAGSLPLYFSVTSESDTTLVINAPDGSWQCNDDYTGLDPAVVFANPSSGLYNIWVGTYSSGSGLQAASLHVSELQVATEANLTGSGKNAVTGLDFSLPPNFGSTNLAAGYADDPHTVQITAGGTVSVSSAVGDVCNGYASGHVSAAPDYSVTYEAGSFPPSFQQHLGFRYHNGYQRAERSVVLR